MTGSNLIALASAAVALISGWFAFSGNRAAAKNRARELDLSGNAQMMQQVKETREELAVVKREAGEAERRSIEAETRSRKVQRDMNAVQDWIDRVIRARDAYMADHGGEIDSIADTGAIRLLRAINGGPHLPSQ